MFLLIGVLLHLKDIDEGSAIKMLCVVFSYLAGVSGDAKCKEDGQPKGGA